MSTTVNNLVMKWWQQKSITKLSSDAPAATGSGVAATVSINQCLYVSYCIMSEVKLFVPLRLDQAPLHTHTHRVTLKLPSSLELCNQTEVHQYWSVWLSSWKCDACGTPATSVAPNTRVKKPSLLSPSPPANDKMLPLWRSITSAIILMKRKEIKCWVYCLMKINGRFLCFTVGHHGGLQWPINGLARIKIIDSARHCSISVIRKDVSINPSVMISGQDGGQPSQITKRALRVAGVDKSR